MPFDGIGFAIDDRVGKIDQVIDLLATRKQWCKANFKTPDGRYCIRGAMMAVEADFLKPIVLQAIREITGERYLRIESFNDHRNTTMLRCCAFYCALGSLRLGAGLAMLHR